MTLDEWQLRVDTDFPAGAVVRVENEAEAGQVFKTTGATVVRMEGDKPVLRFWDSGADKDYMLTVSEYELTRVNPVRVVRIESVEGRAFLFGGGLTPENVQVGWMATRRVERDTALEFAR